MAVKANEVRLRQFTYKSSYVFMFHVGVGVKLASGCRVRSLAVVNKELQLFHNFTIFSMTLTIKHKRFGNFEIAFAHQCFLYLILDIFDCYAFMNVQMAQDMAETIQVYWFFNRIECLYYGVHNLVKRESVVLTVTLGDTEIFVFHFFLCDILYVNCSLF